MAALVLALMSPAGAAAEAAHDCPLSVKAVPAHPSARERIGLGLTGMGTVPLAAVLARASVTDGAVDLEIVLTDAPAAFAGYRRVGDPGLDAVAYVEPLAPGVHAVTTSVRVHERGVERAPCQVVRDTIEVAEAPGAVTLVDAVEYYNRLRDRYFITADAPEIADLDRGVEPGWSRTGQGFKAYAVNRSDNRGEAVCRFVSPPGQLDAHFLSASYRECSAVGASTKWRYEARVFDMPVPDTRSGACPDRTGPVYRLWNPGNGDHRWTLDPSLRGSLLERGWVAEGYGPDGVSMCSPRP